MKMRHARNRKFTGGEQTLAHLHEVLVAQSEEPHPNVVVLYGIGGVGKTQLAIEYAYRKEHDFSSIFWIDGTNCDYARMSMLEGLRNVRQHYELHSPQESQGYRLIEKFFTRNAKAQDDFLLDAKCRVEQNEVEVFLEWLTLPGNDNWLVIYDNVDDLETFDIRTFFPHSSCGNIIVTSRRLELTTLYQSIGMFGMKEIDALSLLNKTSNLKLITESSGMRTQSHANFEQNLLKEFRLFESEGVGRHSWLSSFSNCSSRRLYFPSRGCGPLM